MLMIVCHVEYNILPRRRDRIVMDMESYRSYSSSELGGSGGKFWKRFSSEGSSSTHSFHSSVDMSFEG